MFIIAMQIMITLLLWNDFLLYLYVNLSSLLIFEKAPFCLVAKEQKIRELRNSERCLMPFV